METAYERAMRLRKKPEAQPSTVPVKKDTGLQTAMANFWQKVDEKRNQGLTDTAILDGLSSRSPDLRDKITQSRMLFSTSEKVKNDRDLVNYLSVGFSGQKPTVESVPLKEEKKKEEVLVTEKLKKVIPETAGFYKDVAIGGAKEGISFLAGLSSLGQKGLESTVGKAMEFFGFKIPKTPTATEALKASGIAEPKGAVQKGAMFGTQLGEFFLPGGLLGKLKYAKGLLGLGEKALVEGTALAGILAAQKGKVDEESKTDFIIGAAFPIATFGLKPIARAIQKKLINPITESAWKKILRRSPTEVAENKALAKEASDLGLVGTRGSIGRRLQKEIEDIEIFIDGIFHPTTGIALSPSAKGVVSDLKATTSITIDEKKLITSLKKLRDDYAKIPGEEASVKVFNGLINSFRGKSKIFAAEANALKKAIYQNVQKSYGKGMFEAPAKAEGQKSIAHSIKIQLEKSFPALEKPLEKEAVLVQTRIAILKAVDRGSTGKGISLNDLIVGGGGFAMGGPAGLIPLGLAKASQSPLVLSTSTKMLNYFNTLSPTQKIVYYNGLKYLTSKYDNVIKELLGIESSE